MLTDTHPDTEKVQTEMMRHATGRDAVPVVAVLPVTC